MAWTVDQTSLGTPVAQAGSATTVAITTSATVASGAWIFLLVNWWTNAGTTVSSIAGGGLSWAQMVANTASQPRASIWHAEAASGLASATAITATFSGGSFSRSIGGSSFTGGGSAIEDTSTGSGGTTAHAVTLTAAASGDLLLESAHMNNNAGSSTPDANSTELLDFADGGGPYTQCLQYRIASAGGNADVGGTFTGGSEWVSAGTVQAGPGAPPWVPEQDSDLTLRPVVQANTRPT